MFERFRTKPNKETAPAKTEVKPKKVEWQSRSNPEVKKKLEAQFDHPEILNFRNDLEDFGEDSRVEVYDVKPENLKSEVPVYFAPGWSATPLVHKENILAIAEAGREVVSPNLLHGVEASPRNGWPLEAVRKSEAILKTLRIKKIEKTDVIAHSEGAMNAVMAATIDPEKFIGRSMVLFNPPALIGPDDLNSFRKRFQEDAKHHQKNQKDPEIITKDRANPSLLEQAKGPVINMWLKSPLRSLKEIQALTTIHIEELLRELRKQGIKIAIVHTVDDHIFPMVRLNKMVTNKEIDGFYSIQGTHAEILMRPEYYGRFAEGVLSDLEKKPAVAT